MTKGNEIRMWRRRGCSLERGSCSLQHCTWRANLSVRRGCADKGKVFPLKREKLFKEGNFCNTWVNLEDTVFSEISYARKDKHTLTTSPICGI